MTDLPTLFRKAADSAEANAAPRAGLLSPSRAGYPMLQLVLDNLIIPRYNELIDPPSQDPLKKVTRQMTNNIAVGIGHLFEKTVEPVLQLMHPSYELQPQQPLTYGCYSGTADFLLVDKANSSVLVYETKAVNLPTKREIVEHKFSDDCWSYVTQLALYTEAVKLKYSDYSVASFWLAYSVPGRKLFVIANTYDTEVYAKNAIANYFRLEQVMQLVNSGDFEAAAALTLQTDCDLMFDKGFYYGRLAAATPTHFHPLSVLFLDPEEGTCLTREACRGKLKKLLEITHSATGTDTVKKLQEILNNGT